MKYYSLFWEEYQKANRLRYSKNNNDYTQNRDAFRFQIKKWTEHDRITYHDIFTAPSSLLNGATWDPEEESET